MVAPRETGRERGRRANGPARAHRLVEPTWPSGLAPARLGAARDHRGRPSGLLERRDDEGGVSVWRGRSVDASPGGGQDVSWSAMVKTGGF